MLVEWINPMYLDTGVVTDIRARFKDESEIQLQEFLLVNSCQLLIIRRARGFYEQIAELTSARRKRAREV